MSDNLSFLIIDDEESIVFTLVALVKKSFPSSEVLHALDGLEGYNIIKSKHPKIVISDYNMPKMNGLEIIKRVRADSTLNDIYFMVITANSDKDVKIQSLEIGADDFINKPFVTEELLARLRSASRYVRLQNRLKEENNLLHRLANELESSIADLKALAYNLLHARIPNTVDKMKKVNIASIWMAKQLGELSEEQISDIDIASSLCDCGKIILPDNLIKTPVVLDGLPTNQLMHQVPLMAREILSRIRRYKDAANILYHLFENFDGTGFPDKLQSWQIPLGSRIIRTVSDFEDLRTYRNMNSNEAFGVISKSSKRFYDNRCVTLLEQFIALNSANESGIKETAVQLHELKEGMVLTRNIITNSGMKLVPSGAILRDRTISTIIAHSTADPIIGDIYVKV
jgi:response regulator RpfG family c-di-GMP phosphodiesterase